MVRTPTPLEKHKALGFLSNSAPDPLETSQHSMLGHHVRLDIMQLMHYVEVNIRICQHENSDVHRGEAEVNITFEG